MGRNNYIAYNKHQYKRRRNRRRTINRIIIVACLILALSLIIGGVVTVVNLCFPNESKPEETQPSTSAVTQPATQPSTAEVTYSQEGFSAKALVHNSKENCGYSALVLQGSDYKAFYPKTPSQAINDKSKSDAEKFANNYFTAMKSPVKCADFTATLSGNNMLSVVTDIKGFNAKGQVETADYFTRVYTLNASRELQRDDIFTEGFYAYASEQVRSYFKNNKDTKDKCSSDKFLNATEGYGVNFDRFSFDDNGCTLHFDSKTLFDFDGELYDVRLKYDDISDYMKLGKDGNSKPEETGPTSPLNIDKNAAVDPSKPMVAITFDDGPSSENTPIILDTLEKYNARATFFVTGTNAGYYPEILKREVALGCQIGNHSMKHTAFPKQENPDMLAAVEGVNDIVKKATGGYEVTIVRPPYGDVDKRVKQVLSDYPLILWSIDTLDWSTRNTQSTVDSVMSEVYDGAIILMHDIHAETAAAVQQFVPKLIDAGYQLVTIDELYYYKKMPLTTGEVHCEVFE